MKRTHALLLVLCLLGSIAAGMMTGCSKPAPPAGSNITPTAGMTPEQSKAAEANMRRQKKGD